MRLRGLFGKAYPLHFDICPRGLQQELIEDVHDEEEADARLGAPVEKRRPVALPGARHRRRVAQLRVGLHD